MYAQILTHCSNLSGLKVAAFGFVLAIAVELFTVWIRFGLGLRATVDTAALAGLTFGVRIHHGYVGVLLGLVGWWCLRENVGLRNLFLMAGLGLALSDFLHHVCVLWPITGSPEFDLFYPKPDG